MDTAVVTLAIRSSQEHNLIWVRSRRIVSDINWNGDGNVEVGERSLYSGGIRYAL